MKMRAEKRKRLLSFVMVSALVISSVFGSLSVSAEDTDTAAQNTESSEKGMRGDINGDGTINVLDAVRYKVLLCSDTACEESAVYRADANGDGTVNVRDLIAVIRHITGAASLPADELYHARGTGKEKPSDYKPDNIYSYFSVYKKANVFDIDFIKDKEFQKTVNRDISDVLKEHSVENVTISLINGYLNLCFYDDSKDEPGDTSWPRYSYSYVRNLNYDLKNGVRIEKFSDLFYKDTDFVPAVNELLSETISDYYSDMIRTDFTGLTGEADNFSLDRVFFEGGTCFERTTGVGFGATDAMPLSSLGGCSIGNEPVFDSMVISEYYNNDQVIDERYSSRVIYIPEWNTDVSDSGDGEQCYTVKKSRFLTESERAERQAAYDKVYENAKKIRSDECDDKNAEIIIERFNCRTDSEPFQYEPFNVLYVSFGEPEKYPYSRYMFDPVTGERVRLSDILGKEFEKYDSDYVYMEESDTGNGKIILSGWVSSEHADLNKEFTVDKNKISTKYFFPVSRKAEICEFDKPVSGMVFGYSADNKTVYGYKSSYILNYGPKEIQWEIEGNWSVIAKRKCWSHGYTWYECWDADDGDYYGWIRYDKAVFS